MALSFNLATYVITIPQNFLGTPTGSVYPLDTNAFRIALDDFMDSELGIMAPKTHNHNTQVSLGGIQYARVLEILAPWTITFQETGLPYVVTLSGSNNNILERTNLGTVQILANNSAGLINVAEIQAASFNNRVSINSLVSLSGTAYPAGNQQNPVNNLADAITIATARGFEDLEVIGNLTVNANIAGLHIYGQGATLNVAKTTITLVSGTTTNSHYYDCKVTGIQNGESNYHRCVIEALSNAHCFYDHCGMADGTLSYTIQQATSSTSHTSYYKECYSDEGTAVIDRNSTKMNIRIDGWMGNIMFKNQNRAYVSSTDKSGDIWIHMNGGTVTVHSSCTQGTIFLTGTGTLINQSTGTKVDASGFFPEQFKVQSLNLESLRDTHQGFGERFFCDWANGSDVAPGTSPLSPFKTITAAIAACVSGRGDVIYLMAPAAGAAIWDEHVVLNKEDIHIRGPGRGAEIKPSISGSPTISITSNNCSLSGFVARSATGSNDNVIVVSGKFSRMNKLYIVGSGQGVGTGSGIVFTHGDYHELVNVESEKCGRSGLLLNDLSNGTGNGSPREISVKGGNYYLNGQNGIEITGDPNYPTNSTRIIRILGANVHDNNYYGISADANSTKIVIDSDSTVHSNLVNEILNLSTSLQHFSDRELITQVKYRVESMRQTHQAFGAEFYVEPYGGHDNNIGTSEFAPFATIAKAMSECQSGRGDVIYLIAPGTGSATFAERVLLDKEDVHIRGPGRGVQVQPGAPDTGPVITITANNCSMAGFIVRTPVGSTTDHAITISGKFSRLEKLYLVGQGQYVGTQAVGIEYTGGDYHELWDMEVEKFGDSAVELNDQSDLHSNGSPREISIYGGNFYLNGEHGLCFHGKAGAAVGTTSRIIRLLRGANIHDNGSYGIHSDPNVSGVTIDDSIMLHGNNAGGSQVNLEGTGYYKLDEERKLLEIRLDRNADLIESQRGLHTWQGQFIYVGPTFGNDITGNGSRENPFQTIAKADEIAIDGNHDVIYVLADATTGQTFMNEQTVITKSFTFIRGPGRDVVWTTDSPGNLVTVQNARGCEISGFELRTHTAGVGHGIGLDNAPHCQIHNCYLSYTRGSAIVVENGSSFAWIHNNTIHGTGQNGAANAIDINATTDLIEHCKIENNTIAQSTGDGIQVKNNKAEDIIIRNNVILGCTGYGINIQSGLRSSVYDNKLGGNLLGNLADTGTGSNIQNNQQWATATSAENATAVWGALTADNQTAGSFGEFVYKKLLTVAKFIGLK